MRIPGTYNPTGFETQRLVDTPPMLGFRSTEMGVDFAFRLRDGRMELEALGDTRLGPERPAEEADALLPGLTEREVVWDEDAQ